MPTSADETILARIITDLAAITAGATYTNTLSATAQVQVGHLPVRPPVLPCLFVWWMGEDNDAGAGEIGEYRTTTRYGIAGYVGYTADTPASHVYAAMGFKADICRALEADRNLNGNVYDLRIATLEDITADIVTAPAHYAAVGGIIEVWRERSAGSA